jgi:hypothetical protein
MRPVEGWDAIPNNILSRKIVNGKEHRVRLESYIVLNCPLFEMEERHRWAYEKFNPEAIREQYGKEDAT